MYTCVYCVKCWKPLCALKLYGTLNACVCACVRVCVYACVMCVHECIHVCILCENWHQKASCECCFTVVHEYFISVEWGINHVALCHQEHYTGILSAFLSFEYTPLILALSQKLLLLWSGQDLMPFTCHLLLVFTVKYCRHVTHSDSIGIEHQDSCYDCVLTSSLVPCPFT